MSVLTGMKFQDQRAPICQTGSSAAGAIRPALPCAVSIRSAEVVVIGAGVAGIAAARTLHDASNWRVSSIRRARTFPRGGPRIRYARP